MCCGEKKSNLVDNINKGADNTEKRVSIQGTQKMNGCLDAEISVLSKMYKLALQTAYNNRHGSCWREMDCKSS